MSTPVEAERIKALGIVKSSKRPPTACPLGEAEVEEVRRVEPFEIDVELPERQDEDLKEDPDQLEAVVVGQWFVKKTTSKTSSKDMQKYPPSVLGWHHVADGVDEHVDR